MLLVPPQKAIPDILGVSGEILIKFITEPEVGRYRGKDRKIVENVGG